MGTGDHRLGLVEDVAEVCAQAGSALGGLGSALTAH